MAFPERDTRPARDTRLAVSAAAFGEMALFVPKGRIELAEGAVLVSRDAMVRRYPVPTLWLD